MKNRIKLTKRINISWVVLPLALFLLVILAGSASGATSCSTTHGRGYTCSLTAQQNDHAILNCMNANNNEPLYTNRDLANTADLTIPKSCGVGGQVYIGPKATYKGNGAWELQSTGKE